MTEKDTCFTGKKLVTDFESGRINQLIGNELFRYGQSKVICSDHNESFSPILRKHRKLWIKQMECMSMANKACMDLSMTSNAQFFPQGIVRIGPDTLPPENPQSLG